MLKQPPTHSVVSTGKNDEPGLVGRVLPAVTKYQQSLFAVVPGAIFIGFGQRFDEETGQLEDDEAPNLVLDSLTMPGEDGRLGQASGSFDLTLQTDSFSASSGISTIQGDFEVEIHSDRWALDDLDVQEDLSESSVE